MELTAKQYINKLGGIRPTARKTGFPVTTVQWWKAKNKIAEIHHPKLIETAKEHGFEVVLK